MPTYEYRCQKCGHQFDVFHRKITDRTHEKCPECGGRAKRLISGGAGLVFKGSGFYITDYKRKGEAGGGAEASGDSGSGEKGGDKASGEKAGGKAEKKDSKD
jgi:putative FmdB family regulatory protein